MQEMTAIPPIPANDEDWKAVITWAEGKPGNLDAGLVKTFAAAAVRADRPDMLRRFLRLVPSAYGLTKEDLLLQSFELRAENTLRTVLDSFSDPLTAKQYLDFVFVRYAQDKKPQQMETALRAGADINADGYAAWGYTCSVGTEEMRAVMEKWYARMEDINPADPWCGTARDIHDFIAEKRAKTANNRPDIVALASDAGSFARWLKSFEKNPSGDLAEKLAAECDAFGNSALDMLGARRKLRLVFESALWDGRENEMTALWEKLPPVYRGQVDIEAERARRACQRLNEAGNRKKWKL